MSTYIINSFEYIFKQLYKKDILRLMCFLIDELCQKINAVECCSYRNGNTAHQSCFCLFYLRLNVCYSILYHFFSVLKTRKSLFILPVFPSQLTVSPTSPKFEMIQTHKILLRTIKSDYNPGKVICLSPDSMIS